jgi:hypothetical protein
MPKRKMSVGTVVWLAAGLLLWVATMIVAKRVLIAQPESAILRGAMVAIGVGGFTAWLAAMVRFIAAQDEFTQRVQLLAIAIAFAAATLVAIVGDFLQTAGFLDHVDLGAIWMLMIVLWWLGMIAASRYYR